LQGSISFGLAKASSSEKSFNFIDIANLVCDQQPYFNKANIAVEAWNLKGATWVLPFGI
jgi:hypothetical protein